MRRLNRLAPALVAAALLLPAVAQAQQAAPTVGEKMLGDTLQAMFTAGVSYGRYLAHDEQRTRDMLAAESARAQAKATWWAKYVAGIATKPKPGPKPR